MKKVLAIAEEDLKELRIDIAAKLNAYMNNCDESKNADGTLRDPKCVYDTLWSELDGYNTALALTDKTTPVKYTKRAADAAKNTFTTKSEN